MDSDINYIIQEALNGDMNCQETLLLKLHPLIYKNIYKYYQESDNNIEDLTQEGYIVILQSLKSYDENRQVHFLRHVKSNIDYFYKNYFRNTKNLRKTISLNNTMEDMNIEYEDIIDSQYDLLKDIIEHEEKKELSQEIAKLSIKEQTILNLYYNEKLSMKQISNKLNIAYRTAISSKYIAIKKLRKFMNVTHGGERNG
ncbi:RNA polymerase sigma factor [Sedimentibacter sp. MB31-C6]|uniref:RNA polymerase sigma factor n=1 Tax=Sedimentibacter sp. MB31-C6 TaxID=3109366 RepID=UPI002DDCB846|nr:sigma-70 family RNA polymerase sigma factor [Sedimentibacter sp. MB36-C1]WSI03732.1 sigma-70 family RNA polymerase sigma factor [Sedimentibacter sp. MB36-C1]